MGYDTEALGILFAVFGFIMIIALVVGIISIIGMWKMFKKAGEEGWKAIIPIYNVYTLSTIVGVSPWWILIVFVGGFISGAIPALSIVGSALSIYFSVILCVSTAKSFGKDEGFAVGLFFLSPIFHLILGFGSAEYQGKKPMKDPIMEFVNKEIFHKDTATPEANVTEEKNNDKTSGDKFCTNCGAKIDGDSSFCTSCGTKVN